MPFSARPFRRVPVQCAVTYSTGLSLNLMLAYRSGFESVEAFLLEH